MVTRVEMPVPQLREHWDHGVVCRTHWSADAATTRLQAAREMRRKRRDAGTVEVISAREEEGKRSSRDGKAHWASFSGQATLAHRERESDYSAERQRHVLFR